ncbi:MULTISPECIES: hypothetical protein [unclassified Microcoleus]
MHKISPVWSLPDRSVSQKYQTHHQPLDITNSGATLNSGLK